jgi:hypothetical protein
MDLPRTKKKTRPDIRFVHLEPDDEKENLVQGASSPQETDSKKNKTISSPDFEKELQQVKKRLDNIPSSYRNPNSFNCLQHVLQIIKSEQVSNHLQIN